MELHNYTTLFRRRILILLVTCVLAGGATFFLSNRQPRSYEAYSTISVGNYLEATDPKTDEIRSAQELAQTYAVLATTRDVMQSTLTETQVDMAPEKLKGKIKIEVLPETLLIRIRITHEEPELAAMLANELATQLIVHSQSTLTPEQQVQLEDAKLAVNDLDQQLQDAQTWLDDIDKVLSEGAEPYSPDLQWIITQRNVIIDHISRLTENRMQYFLIVTQLEQHDSNLTLVESATVPTETTNISPLALTGFAALGGMAAAAIVILLLDYFDNTIRKPHEVAATLTSPLLARIPKRNETRANHSSWLSAITTVGDPLSENYRMLRTNLLLSKDKAAKESSTTYIVTSPGVSEGKSTTIANLAAVLAIDEKRVLLIDADLRQPSLHKRFGLAKSPGLTAMLSTELPSSPEDSNPDGQKQDFDLFTQDTQIQGLQVITSGDMAGHPAEMLGSDRLVAWLTKIQSTSDADIILIDTPPALAVPDAFILASKLDALVILVLRAGKTNTNAVLEIKKQFEHFNLDVAGVVLNAVPLRDLGFDYGSYYQIG